MKRFASEFRVAIFLVSVLVLALAGSTARADFSLVQYEFQGQTGGETSLAPSLAATGLTGTNFTESTVLTPSAGVNSMNSSGWNLANANYSFGFTIQAGNVVTVDQIILTSRSSGTGPGFLNVEASVDGGALKTVATITQTSTNFNDEFLAITPVTAMHSLTFVVVAANQTSAAGGTIGSAGTFRIGDYNPAGTPTPFTIDGTISPPTNPPSVPEPASIAMTAPGRLVCRGLRRPASQGSPGSLSPVGPEMDLLQVFLNGAGLAITESGPPWTDGPGSGIGWVMMKFEEAVLWLVGVLTCAGPASGGFEAGNLVVVRVGDGKSIFGRGSAAPVFLDEIKPSTGE